MADDLEDQVIDAPEVAEPVSQLDDVHNDVAAAIASLKGEPEAAPDNPDAEPKDPAAERVRGPDGKFVSKEAAPEQAAASEQKSPPADDPTKASTERPSTAASAPPVSWAADSKALWASLPPAVQQAVLKRETEVSNGFRQKSEDVRRYEQALTPIAQESQKRGLTTEQGIQRLMDGQRFLETQPAQAILWLAQSNGIDLAELASNPPAATQQVRPDPMFAQVTQTVQSLQSRLDEMTMGQNQSLVESFSASNPHYADVEDALPDLIKEVRATRPNLSPAETLKAAYDRAVWLNPEVRAKVIAEQTAAARQAAVTPLADKARQAQRAAVSVKGSSAASTPPARRPDPNGTVHDDVRAAIAQLKSA
jgi:hypothetical protein